MNAPLSGEVLASSETPPTPETPTTPPTPETTAQTPPERDLTQLHALLSRLAALQGEAVSRVALSMTGEGRDGAELENLEPAELATELWLAIFPAGQVQAMEDAPTADDMPALWLPDDGVDGAILTGRLSSGDYQVCDGDGEQGRLTAEQMAEGRVLRLLTPDRDTGKAQGGTSGVTAASLFRSALFNRKKIFFEAAIATTFINVLALGTSMYAMNVYDRVVPSRTLSTLWVMSIGVLLAYLFDYVLRHVRGRYVESACREIDNELSAVFFDKMLSIRMDKRPATIGTFASQMRQFESVRNFLTSTTMFVIADAPFALLFIGVIAMIAGWIAIIPLLLFPLTIAVSMFSNRKFTKLAEERVKENNQRNGLLVEVISGIESVKAAQGGWKFSRRWDDINTTLAENDLKTRLHGQTLMHTVQMIQQLLNVLIIVAGVFAIHEGALTMGALIACTIIGGRALAPAASLTGIVAQWHGAKASLRVLETIMQLPSEGDGVERLVIPDKCRGRLDAEQSSFTYRADGEPALTIDRLTFQPGERVMIMGASGSGKSTLLKLLSGLYQPTDGRVLLDGIDMRQLAPGFVREHIGYLPQDVWLFEGTLRDNITIGLPSPSDNQILAAAQWTGLINVLRGHPLGLQLPISEGGRGLSAGQRQLVGLTRMMIAQPNVILLDEPTAAMDQRLEAHVVQQLTRRLPPDRLLLMATHKPELLQFSTRVLIIDRGRVVIDGPRDLVLERLRQKLDQPIGSTQESQA